MPLASQSHVGATWTGERRGSVKVIGLRRETTSYPALMPQVKGAETDPTV